MVVVVAMLLTATTSSSSGSWSAMPSSAALMRWKKGQCGWPGVKACTWVGMSLFNVNTASVAHGRSTAQSASSVHVSAREREPGRIPPLLLPLLLLLLAMLLLLLLLNACWPDKPSPSASGGGCCWRRMDSSARAASLPLPCLAIHLRSPVELFSLMPPKMVDHTSGALVFCFTASTTSSFSSRLASRGSPSSRVSEPMLESCSCRCCFVCTLASRDSPKSAAAGMKYFLITSLRR